MSEIAVPSNEYSQFGPRARVSAFRGPLTLTNLPFDDAKFAEAATLLPELRLDIHLRSMLDHFEEILAGGLGRNELKSRSHTLVTLAGMLGFGEISSLSADIDSTPVEEIDGSGLPERLRGSIRAAQPVLRRLLTRAAA